MNTKIDDVLAYFDKVVFQGDLMKLIIVARESKKALHKKNEQDYLNIKMATQPAYETTTRNVTDPYYYFDSSAARCAIPMSMSLFAIINFLANTFEDLSASTDYPRALSAFLAKSGTSLDHHERTILASIHRNGMMHGFFPRGGSIEIEFDPDNISTQCLVKTGEVVTFHVMALYNIVKRVFYDSYANRALKAVMQNNLDIWLSNKEGRKIENEIRAYKKDILMKEFKAKNNAG